MFGGTKVWRISIEISLAEESLANYCDSLKLVCILGILANKVWRIITIRQIRQTLVPPNFRRLRYYCNKNELRLVNWTFSFTFT